MSKYRDDCTIHAHSVSAIVEYAVVLNILKKTALANLRTKNHPENLRQYICHLI